MLTENYQAFLPHRYRGFWFAKRTLLQRTLSLKASNVENVKCYLDIFFSLRGRTVKCEQNKTKTVLPHRQSKTLLRYIYTYVIISLKSIAVVRRLRTGMRKCLVSWVMQIMGFKNFFIRSSLLYPFVFSLSVRLFLFWFTHTYPGFWTLNRNQLGTL